MALPSVAGRVDESGHDVGALDDQVRALVDRPADQRLDADGDRRRLLPEAGDHRVAVSAAPDAG